MMTAAEAEDIRVRAAMIRGHESGVCMAREKLPITTCWCHGAGHNGLSLPCPPKADPEKEPEELREFHFPEMPVPWFPRR